METIVLTEDEQRLYLRLQLKFMEDEYSNVGQEIEQIKARDKERKNPMTQKLIEVKEESRSSLDKAHKKVKTVLDAMPVKPGQPIPTKPDSPGNT